MESTSSGSASRQPEPSRNNLTHEDAVHLKRCRDEALLYGQIPLTTLFTLFVSRRHRAGFYNHMSFPAVFGRYFLALSGGIVLGSLIYMPFCLSRLYKTEMIESSLKDVVHSDSYNSFLKVPSIGSEEPFRDPFLDAVKSNNGFTTYKDRREYSRQLLTQRQQQQQQQ